MPYTVHTPDGQAHTYPDRYPSLKVTDRGDLLVYDHADTDSVIPPEWQYLPPAAAYPAGQWTHYHVEPTPYETGTQSHKDTGNAQCETQPDTTAEGKDKWQAEFQRQLNAGRKASEAQ